MRRGRVVDRGRPRPRGLVGPGARDVVRRRGAVGPPGPLDRRAVRGFRMARRHIRRRHPGAQARRSRLGGGAAARGHRQTGAPSIPDPGAHGAVGGRRHLHRRRPCRVGGAAAAVGAAGRADRPADRRRRAIGRSDQPAGQRCANPPGAPTSWCTETFTAQCFSSAPRPRGSPTSRPTGGPHPGRRAWSSSMRCLGVRPTTG